MVSEELLSELWKLLDDRRGIAHTPDGWSIHVIKYLDLIINYLKEINSANLLSLYSGLGIMPVALMKNKLVSSALAIEKNKTKFDIAKQWGEGLNIDWMLADPLLKLSELDEQFDLIVSSPPLNMKRISYELTNDPSGESYQDAEEAVLIIESLHKLSQNGEAIFILPNSFPSFNQGKRLKKFQNLGFCINAIVDIPTKYYREITSLPMSIFFISRIKTYKTFVSYLDPDKTFDDLVADLINHKKGLKPSQGFKIDAQYYNNYELLSLQKEIDYEISISGAQCFDLDNISKSIIKGSSNKSFQETPNTIYLPSLGNSPAVSKLEALHIKPQNYFQIVLDGSLAFADYVAGFFNSPIGLKIRKSLTSGNIIPQISISNLRYCIIPLPALEDQIQIVKLDNTIQTLKINLDAQSKDLWAKPKEFKTIARKLQSFNRQASDQFKDWIESLPFPIASILWRYHTAKEVKVKVEHLLHFFEAFAQFNTSLLLSAYYQDKNLFNINKSKWIDPESDFFKKRRASFGNWVIIGERLARFTRSQLSDKENKEKVLDLFHTDNTEFLETIAHKDLYQVFHNAQDYRNNWTGHGGLSGDSESKRRLVLLEQELTRLRELLKDIYIDYLLIQPISSRFSQGLFNNTIRNVLGANASFPEEEFISNIALDINDLYFSERSRRDPLKLIHFFRMLPSPQSEQNACYYYSRFDDLNIRYVSYHFESESERDVEDSSLVEFFDSLDD